VTNEPEERTARYAVRFSAQADRDITTALLRLAEITGEAAALTWRNLLLTEAGTLAETPRRFAVDEQVSRRLQQETRRMLFRPSPTGAGYHIYYVIHEESPDGPRVMVLHVRHAARRPITREEARQIVANI